MATVSGIKVFKDSIKFPSYILQAVDYTCPDEPKSTSFHSMIISSSLIYSTGIDFSGGSFTTVYDSDGWANTYYKTVDFGEAEQTVDDVFFSWLDENIVKEPETKTIRTLMINGTVTTEWNGKPVKQVTVDGVTYKMPETSTTYTIKAGTYTWKNEPTDPYKNILQSNFNITSNGKNYIGINIYGSLDFRYVIAEGNEQFVYSFEGHDWGTEAFKTFAVESDALVSAEFYNFLMENISNYEGAEPQLITVTYTEETGGGTAS